MTLQEYYKQKKKFDSLNEARALNPEEIKSKVPKLKYSKKIDQNAYHDLKPKDQKRVGHYEKREEYRKKAINFNNALKEYKKIIAPFGNYKDAMLKGGTFRVPDDQVKETTKKAIKAAKAVNSAYNDLKPFLRDLKKVGTPTPAKQIRSKFEKTAKELIAGKPMEA